MTTKTTARPGVRPVKAIRATGPEAKIVESLRCGHLSVEVVDIDAETAAQMLARNATNRPLRTAHFNNILRDMNNGDWKIVGDPIRFDVNDDVVDGQHRLEAIVNADPGLSFPNIVVRGIDPDDRHVIDTGKPRSAADQLRIAGYQHYVLLSAAAKWSIIVERLRADSGKQQRAVTHAEILSYCKGNTLLQECVAIISNGAGRKIDMPGGYVCTAYYQMALLDEPAADEFIARLADGASLPSGDAILALRETLRESRIAGRQRPAGVDADGKNIAYTGDIWLSLLFRAWNHRRQSESVRKLNPIEPRAKKPYPIPELT